MASTNKTTNYELSQYVGSDKPTYLGDYNGDMLKIDTQMKANATAVATAQSTADTASATAGTALTNAGTAQTTAETANSTATTALSKATTNETEITKLKNKTVISAKQNVDNTIYTSNTTNYSTKITNWGTLDIKGNDITFDSTNNNFVIGSNTNHIIVSGTLSCANISSGTTLSFFGNRIRNNEPFYFGHSFHLAGSTFESLTIASEVIAVQEGDIIEFRIGMSENGKSATVKQQSYITIEEL